MRMNDDIENLLGAVEIPILFVGIDLTVRRFNTTAGLLLNLRRDALARPLREATSALDVVLLEKLVGGLETATPPSRGQDSAGTGGCCASAPIAHRTERSTAHRGRADIDVPRKASSSRGATASQQLSKATRAALSLDTKTTSSLYRLSTAASPTVRRRLLKGRLDPPPHGSHAKRCCATGALSTGASRTERRRARPRRCGCGSRCAHRHRRVAAERVQPRRNHAAHGARGLLAHQRPLIVRASPGPELLSSRPSLRCRRTGSPRSGATRAVDIARPCSSERARQLYKDAFSHGGTRAAHSYHVDHRWCSWRDEQDMGATPSFASTKAPTFCASSSKTCSTSPASANRS